MMECIDLRLNESVFPVFVREIAHSGLLSASFLSEILKVLILKISLELRREHEIPS